ncbi:hypothetical protein [Legionella parisiensis]|uniref:Uncharacterized protein n=1 Tax=Legionella parisiensis TaxID=45071 RepID=A0A1E5JT22_9GAMM|nr:hypothetical protein [Legionella parisiensis]KTD45137.1 hypothetical protein Lpar_0008 [Legionella parisiensis]OEH47178.1 hypothetical protein lpari_01832 [Legionella parisiensis]STX76241.1 Uncharacterised protein [Legionella parisiensis]
MKNVKEKYLPVSESITTDEGKTSSIKLALQQFKKEAEKKEVAEEAAKIRCRICFKEIAPKRLCSGHGGSVGDSENDSANSNKIYKEKGSYGADNLLTKPSKGVETKDELIAVFDSGDFDEKSFDPKIIAELIARGQLLVKSDREAMTLTIKLVCESNSLTEVQRMELKNFMEAIIKDFYKFKEENHLSDDCIHITHDEEGSIIYLRISMPSLSLYDAFIEQLANNLVETAHENDEFTKDQNCAPNPLSMQSKVSPSTARDEIENNEEEQEITNPSPFQMQPW